MKLVTDKITLEEIKKLATEMFGDLVKAVVDIGLLAEVYTLMKKRSC